MQDIAIQQLVCLLWEPLEAENTGKAWYNIRRNSYVPMNEPNRHLRTLLRVTSLTVGLFQHSL
jgi:hypothetical protein